MNLRSRPETAVEDENPYWISYSDLMSAMLFLFLLAIVVLIFSVNEKSAEADKAKESAQAAAVERDQTRQELENQIQTIAQGEAIRSDMVAGIAHSLVDLGIAAEASEDGAVLSIPSTVLGFDKASYEINDQYRDYALELGREIAQALKDKQRAAVIDTITIEGHTDNKPHQGLEGTGNWGLSTFRAISLWQLWDEELQGDSRLTEFKNADNDYLLSVAGYAETRPIQVPQTTDAQRAKNRRIDIRFQLRPPKSDDIRATLDSIVGNSEVD